MSARRHLTNQRLLSYKETKKITPTNQVKDGWKPSGQSEPSGLDRKKCANQLKER
jgi:hypothetical protein